MPGELPGLAWGLARPLATRGVDRARPSGSEVGARPKRRLVAVTGFGQEEDRQATEAGFDAFLVKCVTGPAGQRPA
jgi:hypothetical protein